MFTIYRGNLQQSAKSAIDCVMKKKKLLLSQTLATLISVRTEGFCCKYFILYLVENTYTANFESQNVK